jgi:hypothetical protein
MGETVIMIRHTFFWRRESSSFSYSVIEHIVEKMDVVVIKRKLNFSCPEVVKSEFELQDLECESCLRCGSSSSKAGLYFVEGWLLGGRLYKQGIFSGESSFYNR